MRIAVLVCWNGFC